MDKSHSNEAEFSKDQRSRFLPLLIAGIFCFFVAVLLGYGSWKLFGSGSRTNALAESESDLAGTTETNQKDLTLGTAAKSSSVLNADKAVVKRTATVAGTVEVDGGETAVGGGVSQRPSKRIFVDDFLIAETEVTNAEYTAFVSAAKHKAPSGWKNGEFADDAARLPVVNVSIDDARAFCDWKSKELGMMVRLPTYAEWERAASGKNDLKYPWGDEWDEEAISGTKSSRPFPVKSFSANKSPFGAYDMLGNVWEWTGEPLSNDEIVSASARKRHGPEARIHLVLGGSFKEDREKLANSFWTEISADTTDPTVGFRYVIILNNSENGSK